MKRFLALIAAWAVLAPALAADDKPPIESFFKLPQYSAMTLSPDGRTIAALAPLNGRQNVVVLDVEKRAARPVTGFATRDVVTVGWINNKRLLLRTGTLGTRDSDFRGGGLMAVDSDGSASRLVGEGVDEQLAAGARMVYRPIALVRTLPGDTDDIIASEIVLNADMRSEPGPLFRIDTRTGRRTILSTGKPDSGPSENWIVDRNGIPRVFFMASKNLAKVYYRKNADSPWQKLDEFSTLSGDQWTPVGVSEEDGTLYVISWRGRDKGTLMRYDPEKRSFGEVLAAHPQVDMRSLVRTRAGVLLGATFDADKRGVAWFDEGLAKMQSAIDRALPNTVNSLAWSDDRQRFLITARSDVLPASFYLFDVKSGKLEWLADSRPWVDPKKMSPMTPVRYLARDGLEIPAYLTVPKGSGGKNLPLVVVVHGGPWVPGDDWSYDPEAQFLASRGYAVLQPNFRGTTRYGWKHFSSSFKQWGLTMQDDITDGVQWAINEGVADPKRVCIYGASYGGYATMMGLAKTPDLYKCGINYVGVTDLDLFVNATWSDFAYSEFLKYEVKDMFGDWDRDRAQLKATSPVELAARIKAPVMMAYGAADIRVVPEHGTRMKAALEKLGAKPRWMMVDGEGHGFRDLANQVMFYGEMEKFLDENIGSRK